MKRVTVLVEHDDGQVQVQVPTKKDKTVEETLQLAVAMVTASYKTMIESEDE